ncbi:AAA family ATPase [Planococcus sp. X10-3]|uniref:AAA family ATPase n=1 Tax=Planococcus sp. X10-3 TaxID=3061240 RepID=UPI003BB1F14B
MHNSLSKSNTSSFLARDNELNNLISKFTDSKENRTNFSLILGDSGLGKTRLIQEFYHYLSKNEDPGDFWPDVLNDTVHTMTISPAIETFDKESNNNIPWYWFAIRCTNNDERNNGQHISPLNQIRNQVRLQLHAIIEEQKKKTRQKSALKSSLTLIANYAFPGSSAVYDVVESVVQNIETGIGSADSIKDLWKFSRTKTNNNIKTVAENEEYQSLVNQTLDLFSVLFQQKESESIPLVLVVDDAQWADKLTLKFLEELVTRGNNEGWPVLIISTCWESSFKEQLHNFEVNNTSFASLYHKLSKNNFNYQGDVSKIVLSPVPIDAMTTIIRSYFPKLNDEACGTIADQCSGDLELLKVFIDRLNSMHGYFSSDGELKVPLKKLKFKQHKKKEVFRERILSLGKDFSILLAIGSAQGIKFSKSFLDYCATHFNLDLKESIQNQFTTFETPYNITRNSNSLYLDDIAEYKRRIYYEVSREILDDSPFTEELEQLLLLFYQNSYENMLDSLEDFSDIEHMEDLYFFYEEYINLLTNSETLSQTQLSHLEQLIIPVLKRYLTTGLFEECINRGESIITAKINSKTKSRVIKFLLEAAFLLGRPDDEKKYLTSFELLEMPNDPEYHYYKSRFLLRSSDLDGAYFHAENAINFSADSENLLTKFLCTEQLIKTNFYQGRYDEGSQLIEQVRREFSDFLNENPKRNAYFHHNIALFAHNFEKNQVVVTHSVQAKEMYSSLNDLYNCYISSVNLADGLMSIGKLEEAKMEIERTYEATSDGRYQHAHNIASLCYANILTLENNLSEAFIYYEKGIKISKEINHDWDLLYGQAWRLYALSEFGDPTSFNSLQELYNEATKTGYSYIVSLIKVFILSVSYKFQIDTKDIDITDININETPGLYSLAASIKVLKNELQIDIEQITNTLIACEGLKFGHEIIKDFKEIHAVSFSPELEISFTEWITHYINPVLEKKENIDFRKIESDNQTKITSCNLQCEAMCCYDGVFLHDEEENKIKNLINEYPTIFPKDADEYIVDGNWNNIVTGRKTATVEKNYLSKDYPKHFTSTRCVFSDPQGLCTLQLIATKEEKHPWAYKPKACWMHPLQIEGDKIIGPPESTESDEDFVDENYPGYISYTKCGQACSTGTVWYKQLKQEILYAQLLQKQKI